MPRALFFDAFNGVSGDMIVGALLDLGMPLDHLRDQLERLSIGSFQLQARRVQRQGLGAVDFQVVSGETDPEAGPHSHSRVRGGEASSQTHHPNHRSLREIRDLIQSSELDAWVVQTACRIFERLGAAEAKVHGTPLDEVHFHEVGSLDSIIDIVGACVGFRYFQVERFVTSTLALGGGTISFSHGQWPVPAPATAELVRGFAVRPGPLDLELTTPTGAAIVTALAEPAGAALRLERFGFGAGDREPAEIPNLLRLALGETVETAAVEGITREEVCVLEASIDNMDGELLGHVLELLSTEGALDAFYTPLQMKKSRPGVLLSVLARVEDRPRLAELMFRQTTTLGVRWSPWTRYVLEREFAQLETEWGPVRVKIGKLAGRVVNLWPEYEDLREIAMKRNLPLKQVRQRVLELIGSVQS